MLSADGHDDDSESEAIALLTDIRRVFDEQAVERIPSAALQGAPVDRYEAPWREINHGRPLSPHSLAARLRPFGIRPQMIRFSGGLVARGFERSAFEDAWDRYLGEPEADGEEDEEDEPVSTSADRNGRNTVTRPQ